MRRDTLLIFLIYLLIFAGLATRKGQILVLALPLILYWAFGLVRKPQKPHLHLVRELSNHQVFPGDPIEVTLHITNQGRTLELVGLSDQLSDKVTLIDGQSNLLTRLPQGKQTTLQYTFSGERGTYYFPGVRVVTQDYFGLFRQEEIIPAPGQVLVTPDVIKLPKVDLRPRQTRVYSGLIPTRQGGAGVEFFGLREYQPGDPLRWINSRATARYDQRVFVNEFQQERMADIGLILDARQQGNVITSEGSLFEYGIRATAALAATFLNTNNRVGLLIYGNSLDWTYPGYGKIQRQRILEALAKAQPSRNEVFATLDHLPSRLFPPRSQLIFISPLLYEDTEHLTHLRAREYQLLVISPNPVDFEKQSLDDSEEIRLATRVAQLERNLLLKQLQQSHIQVMDWSVNIPFQQAINQSFG